MTPPTGIITESVRAEVAGMLRRHALCDHCLGRLFARRMRRTSYGQLGGSLRRAVAGTAASDLTANADARCYICRGLLDSIRDMLTIMREKSDGYEFETFVVGATIKPSIMDRDDRVRSAYRLQGADGVKAGLTKELGRRFARMTGGRHDMHEPEISLTMQPAESYCEIRSKPVVIYGRYIKHKRGTPQKQDACTSCLGSGCYACEFHGMSSYDSVQGQISKFLFERIGGTIARFTWVGGEDRESLVSGSGRPFFVRIQAPRRRHIGTRGAQDAGKGGGVIRLDTISLCGLRDAYASEVGPVPFASRVRIRVRIGGEGEEGRENSPNHAEKSAEEEVGDMQNDAAAGAASAAKKRTAAKPQATAEDAVRPVPLRMLRGLSGRPIKVRIKNKRDVEKKITAFRYRRNSPDTLTVWADLDGGIPIKRLVTGDGVSPSISEVLGVACACVQCDFEDVLAYE